MSASIGFHDVSGDGSAVAIDPQDTRVSGRRYVAHFIDGLLYTVALVAFIMVAALLGSLVGETIGDVVLVIGLVVGFTVGHVWFLVILHGSDGRSPGKSAVGIRVVDEKGNPPTRSQMWKRSWPVIIEYFYVIAWVGMMASDYRQRFGDRWADTYVVRG